MPVAPRRRFAPAPSRSTAPVPRRRLRSSPRPAPHMRRRRSAGGGPVWTGDARRRKAKMITTSLFTVHSSVSISRGDYSSNILQTVAGYDCSSTIAISSSVRSYNSYTSRSIWRSVASIWRWSMVLAVGVLASASCLCRSSIRSASATM